jgi:indolepyruvate ferredoxin oxidoreductase beta subunit
MKVRCDIIVAGVGGQGVILVAEILGNAAMKAGLEAMVSEIHGMAQRGGSVISHIRMGRKVYSPTITEASSDIILGFEPIETLRSLRFANEQTRIIMNSKPTIPISVATGAYEYPVLHEIVKRCEKLTEHIAVIDAFKIAQDTGSLLTVNMVLLGALAKTGLLPVREETLVQAIIEQVPEKLTSLNLKAFEAGKSILAKSWLHDTSR